MTTFTTIEVGVENAICTVALNRPHHLNAFNQMMLDEFTELWRQVRDDDDVRVIVLLGNGERAFSTGLDRGDGIAKTENPWSRRLPSDQLGPKSNGIFKPVVCAVHGMCAAGAFYWISESDVVICSDDAEFFDPHVTYGQVSPVLTWSMQHQISYGVALRMSLMGLHERLSAATALTCGLVSEVVPREQLRGRARELAGRIAAQPPGAVQGTVRAAWDAVVSARGAHAERATLYSALGNPLASGNGIPFRSKADRPATELR